MKLKPRPTRRGFLVPSHWLDFQSLASGLRVDFDAQLSGRDAWY